MKTILFVCTGNSCRSVMAAYMLKKMLGDDTGKIDVLSAGIAAPSGIQTTEYTAQVLDKEGIDTSQHRSMPLLKATVKSADLIFVMENFQKQRILEMVPESEGKVHLLREFAKDEEEVIEPEIPDPIGRPLEVYERVFGLIKEGLEHLLRWLKDNGWTVNDKAGAKEG